MLIFQVCECLYTCIYISYLFSANGGHNKVSYVLKLELQPVMKGQVDNGSQISALYNNSRLCQPQNDLYSISHGICSPLHGHFPQSLVICHFPIAIFFPLLTLFYFLNLDFFVFMCAFIFFYNLLICDAQILYYKITFHLLNLSCINYLMTTFSYHINVRDFVLFSTEWRTPATFPSL